MSDQHPFRPDVPAARVVKEGTHRPRPNMRQGLREWLTLTDAGRERLAIVMGLWPLILVSGMVVGLLWTIGYHGAQP